MNPDGKKPKTENQPVTLSPGHPIINGRTQLIGIIGWPVSHSFSPAMHNAAAAALGLNLAYVPLPVHPDDLDTAVLTLPTLGFRGVNVTIPHKQNVMPLLDEIDPVAEAIGAVNTIVVEWESGKRKARLSGYNTDGAGLMADLVDLGVEVVGRDCLVLGAGGSARAAAYTLAAAGGQVQALARRPQQGQHLVDDLSYFLAELAAESRLTTRPLTELGTAVAAATAPLIVNATPLGMTPNLDTSPWPSDLPFPPGTFVYDLVYNPRETKLMRQARAAGCQTTNGLGMLVHQGALAFELWTGVMPDTAVMRAAIDKTKK